MDCEAIVVDAMKPLKIAKRPASKTPKQGLVKKTCMKAAAQPTTTVAMKAAMKATKASSSSAIPKNTMGSDCTGYNAAGLAMEAIGVPYEDVFASDISAPVRAVLRENFSIKEVFADCTTRATPAAAADFYTAGFPCQPYSSMGKNKGKTDPRGSRIVDSILEHIRTRMPTAFVLENVTGLVHRNRRWFDQIINELQHVRHKGKAVYKIYWDIVDSRDFGLAQSRRRVLIIGISEGNMVKDFTWPSTKPMQPLSSFLEPRLDKVEFHIPVNSASKMSNLVMCIEKIKQKGGKLGCEMFPWVADLGPSAKRGPLLNLGYFPCITAARAKGDNYYLFHRGRF